MLHNLPRFHDSNLIEAHDALRETQHRNRLKRESHQPTGVPAKPLPKLPTRTLSLWQITITVPGSDDTTLEHITSAAGSVLAVASSNTQSLRTGRGGGHRCRRNDVIRI